MSKDITKTSTDIVQSNVPLTVLEREICELYAGGLVKKEISIKLGIPVSEVTKLLNKKGVAEFVQELIMSISYATKAERVRVLSRVIEDKVDKLTITDEDGNTTTDFSRATDKDLVSVVKTLDDMLKEAEKKELGVSDNTTYVQILNTMMKDS